MNATTAVFFDMDGTLLDSRLDFDLIRNELGLAGTPILEAMESMTDAILPAPRRGSYFVPLGSLVDPS